MDEIDRHILQVLQMDGRISMTDLGKKVGLSVPAVKERVNKLEDKEIITGYRAIINPHKMNKQVTAFILYDTTRCREFREFCKLHPSVTECHRLAGQFSYLVKVVTESVHTLEQFIDESLAYGESSTLITLSSPVEFKVI
ncbi:Lrp/AsnC family transcriptional regulator [Bacillus sp. BGMRC 2118]|nr:Lrp/AsnC family transcriptional regulator [Bacillus sp. BGMRC 2118]